MILLMSPQRDPTIRYGKTVGVVREFSHSLGIARMPDAVMGDCAGMIRNDGKTHVRHSGFVKPCCLVERMMKRLCDSLTLTEQNGQMAFGQRY